MKDYSVLIQIGVTFDNRGDVYDLLVKFREFLDNYVPVENFDYQDIKLGYRNYPDFSMKSVSK